MFSRLYFFSIAAALCAATVMVSGAYAQDVVGIEICTAEKTMERRTGCLQSNVNFLQASLTKQTLAHQQKLDATNRQIDALRKTVMELQQAVTALRSELTTKTREQSKSNGGNAATDGKAQVGTPDASKKGQ